MAKRQRQKWLTQDMVKLGHELKTMLDRAVMTAGSEFRAESMDGRRGYLFPEPEAIFLWMYVKWAVETGPQLRGGRKRPEKDEQSAKEKLFAALELRDEVTEEQQKSGCSKTAALKTVANRRHMHSWQALEKQIAPARINTLLKAYIEGPRPQEWPTPFWKDLDREHWGAPPEAGVFKNRTHALGSAVSYGMVYTLTNALGLVFAEDED
jgi:hypothetical protein